MQFSKKFRFLAASILALQFTVPVMAGAEESTVVDDVAPSWSAQADYVALGDSLAHGMNEVGAIGLGYTDFVAQTLRKEGFIRSYNKGFAYSGYTTVNVLADLKADVQKKITGFGYGSENANIRSGVKDAEIVTLTVGANDILPLLEQSTSINTSVILAASKKAMENTAAILAEIKMLNPKAQVFVMGYYNSFTYKSEQEQTQFKTLLGLMNSSIKTTAEKAGAIFVPTADIVAANVPDYLPNPENIHLSEAGYQAVAQQAFLPTIKKSALWDNTSAIKVGQVTPTTAHVEWDAATDNVGIAKYNVYVNHQLHKTLSADETVMTLEKLASSTSYTVAVKAVDAAGNESTQSPSASFTTGGTANFTDTKDHWAKDFINQAVASGMMKGYPHDTFKPNQALTRAQAASILVRSLGLSTDEKAPFTDISGYEAKTQAEISAAYANGLVKGSEGKFNPNNQVTRAQLALMINRAYELQTKKEYEVKGDVPFSDIQKYEPETQKAIVMLYELGIASGSEGKFNPTGSTTRAHAAKMLVNFSELLK